jgi:hypothetical protein
MYYTYAYLRKKDRTPYYIGKGQKRRMYAEHWRGNGSFTPKDKDRIIILKYFIDEIDAYNHEMYMIAVLGRKDLGTGILINISGGGEGSSNVSERTRKLISKAHKGKVYSEKTRKKISETRKNKGIKCPDYLKEYYSKIYSGEGNPNYGKKHSPETLAKISAATRGKNLKTRWYLTPSDEKIQIDNLREYCEKNNLNHNCMISLHNGHCKSYKGYKRCDAL